MTRSFRLLATLLLLGGVIVGVAPQVRAQGTGQLVIVPRRTDPSQRIAFSFQQADIDDVLRFLADASGKIVFKDAAVSTTITIRNQAQIPVSQAIRLLQTILSLKGFALVETEDALIVTTTPEARTRRSTRVTVGKDVESIPTGKEIITHIFPLTTADAVRLREELTPLFPAGSAVIIANSDTNSLIVVDEADNVRRIGLIINQIDRPLTDEITVEVIHLKFADAQDMARYLTDLFRPDEQRGGQQQPQPMQPGQPGAAGTRSSSLAQLRGRVRFAADERSNSLIVYASPANLQQIRELVNRLDVNITPRTEFRIVKLQYADATGLADQLTRLLDPNSGGGGGFFFGRQGRQGDNDRGIQDYRVVPDVRTNSLIITAPVDDVQGLEQLVQRLDQPALVENVVRVFQLNNAIASEVATVLRNLFLGVNQQGGLGIGLFGGGLRTQIPPNSPLDLLRQVTIVPNDQTNQLLVSGPAQTFAVIETLLDPERGLDRRLPQVFIEVVIADITLDDETKWGIEWNALTGKSSFGTNFGLNSPTADNTGFRYSVLSQNFQATLQALKTTDRINIVSTPHVLVTDNSPALISIGERVPYAGQTTITNGVAQSSVEFQDVAITLNVTPHISPGNNILMDIDQVVNSLIGFIDIGQGGQAPRTTNRRAGTTVVVKNDQTVVLGGIISDDDQKSIQKIPILGDIPILGQLFRNNTRRRGRTELVVFITPHVVREDTDADLIRQYEQNRLRMDPLKQLEAPFRRPLEITPEALRRARQQQDTGTPAPEDNGAGSPPAAPAAPSGLPSRPSAPEPAPLRDSGPPGEPRTTPPLSAATPAKPATE